MFSYLRSTCRENSCRFYSNACRQRKERIWISASQGCQCAWQNSFTFLSYSTVDTSSSLIHYEPYPCLECSVRPDALFTLHLATVIISQSKVFSLAPNPESGGRGLCICPPHWQRGSVIPQAPGFPFPVALYGGGILYSLAYGDLLVQRPQIV
jgi:hypothetical protein